MLKTKLFLYMDLFLLENTYNKSENLSVFVFSTYWFIVLVLHGVSSVTSLSRATLSHTSLHLLGVP